jgi:hypothetical protein
LTDNADEAKEHAGRAATQAKHAGKNTARAVQKGTGAVAEVAADELRDAREKLEDTADDAVQAARKIDVGLLGKISSDLGVGFLATSVSIYSGLVAYSKFRQAFSK